MTVTSTRYEALKKAFFKKHDNDFHIHTGLLDGYGSWNKDYVFADGAIWSEVYTKVVEPVEVEVHLCKLKVNAELLRTEFYSTETPSMYTYERY